MKIGEMYKNIKSEKNQHAGKSSTDSTTSKQQAKKEIGKDRATINKWVKESEIENKKHGLKSVPHFILPLFRELKLPLS